MIENKILTPHEATEPLALITVIMQVQIKRSHARTITFHQIKAPQVASCHSLMTEIQTLNEMSWC